MGAPPAIGFDGRDDPQKLLLYEEVAELFTVLLRREIFRLTQGRMDLLSELPGEQNTN